MKKNCMSTKLVLDLLFDKMIVWVMAHYNIPTQSTSEQKCQLCHQMVKVSLILNKGQE